jgi:hypothetical protein
VITATNKRLLIFESRGDLNWCTPCSGKPDQDATCFSHSVCIWSKTICISDGQRIATLCESPTALDRVTAPRKRAPETIHSTPADWSRGSYPVSLPSQPTKQWRKSNICRRLTTRHTGPISPACNRYVQYLLTGANPLVANRHMRGQQSWRCRLATYYSPTFPTSCLHFSLRALPGL